MIPLKIIQLTGDQQVELREAQAEIMRMFTTNPRTPGVIVAQIIPPAAEMRVRVLDHALASRLKEILPPEWADYYRCPYCRQPLTDADVTRDDEALHCADCGNRVEYFDAIEAYEESVSRSVRKEMNHD